MSSLSSWPGTITGPVVCPDDADYPAACAGFNLLYTHRPAAIVFARDTTDVVNALSWARQHDLPVRARSGRHCLEGWSTVDDGVVIDVSHLKSAAIDTESRTATVGAGLNQSEAVAALGRAGFAAPTGTEGTVGLVGATLGGGFGLLTRAFGMACDNLLAAEIVVAPAGGGAEVLVADAKTNTDLLWALRGAGNGNLGIVTSMAYSIHPLAQCIYAVARWSGLDDLPAVFEAWQRCAPFLDHRLTSQLEIRRDEISMVSVLASGSEPEALQMLTPVLSAGEPGVECTDANWPDIFAGFQIPLDDEPANWKFLSQFMSDPFPDEAIQLVRDHMSTAPTPACNYFTNALRGAVQVREPSGGAAFAHRDSLFYAEPGAGWGVRGGEPASDDPLTERCLNWIAAFGDALQPFVTGAYTNVPNAGIPDWEYAYWGTNVDRLRAVKAKYDPDNIFRFEQSIAPPKFES
ncbi:FAD-binding oxidoreductase [Mycolicibacterium aubagnense]|uniref:FAD-linked oxidoreductase YgaK n=1 Tax=Mycolicibacterium aubagnense TaxID=319707 RepID=A0ABM7IF98_9MYCO|nr:FAD-binding oxidoreductase [Mycolicibacterium aubagnense]TLH49611.1 FAD-binding protein [Mycolicibacterium aubagnense]WGI32970.1 FAD-binding oxidoreductase [Mycolicibacterium aubagnense]BBX85353.1 putative FAD-linked oxidoreductase YgaK [Mycolicibacterium aubagnense]